MSSEPEQEPASASKPPDHAMPTLKDVAKLAGVSIATASYVINGGPKPTSAQARERVQDAVRALAYVPAAFARTLRGKTMNVLGVMIPHGVPSLVASPYFGPILDGILEESCLLRQNVMLFTGIAWVEVGDAQSHLLDGRCDGFILIAPSTCPEVMENMQQRGIKMAVINAHPPIKGPTYIDVDNEDAARRVVAHLVDLGHRRIGHVRGPQRSSSARLRRDGWLKGLKEAGINPLPEWDQDGWFDQRSGELAWSHWASLPAEIRPTAVFAANDTMAATVMRRAKAMGWRVPEDLSVVGFDDTTAHLAEPPLTSVSQPLREMGRMAVRCLMGHIEDHTRPGEEVILPSPLVIRGSTGPAPGS
jgi:LacI family transcriptional regulator